MALQGLSTAAVAVSVGPPSLLRARVYSVTSSTSRLCCGGRTRYSGIRFGCKAVGENQQGSLDDNVVYNGIYGPWSVDSSDVREVLTHPTFSSFNFVAHYLFHFSIHYLIRCIQRILTFVVSLTFD